jgi:hypothetical protein
MHLFDAIKEMRQISKKQGSFSMIFMSYSRSRGTSDGIVEVRRARLRPQQSERTTFGDHMLNYVDLDTGEEKRLWQPLIMYFNNQKISFR